MEAERWTVTPYLTPEHDDDPMGVYKVEPVHERLTAQYFADYVPGSTDEEFSLDAIHEENAKVARLIAAAPDLLAACRDAIDFIWAEMKENPDKEDMDGSIMDRLIELQTGLISVWRKAGGVK